MFGANEYIGLSLQDDLIRVAKVRVNGDDLKIVKLDRFTLVEKVKEEGQIQQLEEGEEANNAFEEEEDADAIFGLEEDESDSADEDIDFEDLEGAQDDDMALDMVEESETAQSNELLLYNILTDISKDKVDLGLNIPAGHTIFQVIRDTDFNEVKSKDLVEDLEDKLESIYGAPTSKDNYSYEIRDDGSLLLSSVEHESVTLELVNQARELYNGKIAVQSIIPDEMALVGLVRANYSLDPEEMTCLIQFGKTKSRVIFMKGQEVWMVSPIVNEGTGDKSFLNTIFSKILFQLDTGDVPNLDRILLVNNTVGESAVDFFKDNFPDIDVENLSFKEEFLDTENVDVASVPAFTTAIGSALAASGNFDDVFPKISFVPKYVADRQKIFQLQWHGMLILFLIFLTPITFNYFYNQNARQINAYSSELTEMNGQLEELTPIVKKTNELNDNLAILREKLTMLDTLSQGSREWSAKIRMLNQGVRSVGSSWITTFSQAGEGTFIQGYSLYRNRIPRIVNLFEEATLQSVNIQDMREQQVYNFSILVKEFTESDSIYSPPTPEEVQNLIGK